MRLCQPVNHPHLLEHLFGRFEVFQCLFSLTSRHRFFKSFEAKHHIFDMVAEGDKVAIRGKTTMVHRGEFQGIPPTGKHLELHWLDVMRIEDGKNAEEWLSMDLMGFMQQLKV